MNDRFCSEEEFTHADLDKCEPQEAHVYRLLHNIPSDEMTLEKVAKIFGITRERVRQIEDGAMYKINHSWKFRKMRKRLKDYAED